MTAPILHEEEYELTTEIEQTEDGKIFLRVEKLYTYDDVWKARNVYEKYFAPPSMYDEPINYEPAKYYDKWINLIGDEECMMVKKVCVYQFDDLQSARRKERIIKKELYNLIESNYWKKVAKENENNYEINSSFLDEQVNKLGLNITGEEKVADRVSKSNEKNIQDKKIIMKKPVKITMDNYRSFDTQKVFAFTYAFSGGMGYDDFARIFTLSNSRITIYELDCGYKTLAGKIYDRFPQLQEFIKRRESFAGWSKLEMGFGNYLLVKRNIARDMRMLAKSQGPYLYKNHENFLKELCENLNFRDVEDIFRYRIKTEEN